MYCFEFEKKRVMNEKGKEVWIRRKAECSNLLTFVSMLSSS